MPQVIMLSDEFGREEFDCETQEGAREVFDRLKNSCQAAANKDGIERRLILALETWTTD